MKGIFVSYRRVDGSGWAGRLVADLGKHLPGVHVFQDMSNRRGRGFRAGN